MQNRKRTTATKELATLRAENERLAALVGELQLAFKLSWQHLTPEGAHAVIGYLGMRHCGARDMVEYFAA